MFPEENFRDLMNISIIWRKNIWKRRILGIHGTKNIMKPTVTVLMKRGKLKMRQFFVRKIQGRDNTKFSSLTFTSYATQSMSLLTQFTIFWRKRVVVLQRTFVHSSMKYRITSSSTIFTMSASMMLIIFHSNSRPTLTMVPRDTASSLMLKLVKARILKQQITIN